MLVHTFTSYALDSCPIKMANRAGELMCAVVSIDDVRVSSAILSQVFVAVVRDVAWLFGIVFSCCS